jgi:hypothetical protein
MVVKRRTQTYEDPSRARPWQAGRSSISYSPPVFKTQQDAFGLYLQAKQSVPYPLTILKIHFVIFPLTSRSSKFSFSFIFYDQNTVLIHRLSFFTCSALLTPLHWFAIRTTLPLASLGHSGLWNSFFQNLSKISWTGNDTITQYCERRPRIRVSFWVCTTFKSRERCDSEFYNDFQPSLRVNSDT